MYIHVFLTLIKSNLSSKSACERRQSWPERRSLDPLDRVVGKEPRSVRNPRRLGRCQSAGPEQPAQQRLPTTAPANRRTSVPPLSKAVEFVGVETDYPNSSVAPSFESTWLVCPTNTPNRSRHLPLLAGRRRDWKFVGTRPVPRESDSCPDRGTKPTIRRGTRAPEKGVSPHF